MSERIYEVSDADEAKSYVIASTQQQAIHHVVKGRFKARPMSALEVARLPEGVKIVEAKQSEPQAPLV